MKKRFICLLFILVCSICSCNKNEVEKLSIGVPQGAPLLAQFDIAYDNLKNDNYIITNLSGSNDVKEAFISQKYDLIYAPINLGMNIYKANNSYILLRGITFGNLYLGSKTKFDSIYDLNERDVVLFGKNTINDSIVLHLLDSFNVNPKNIDYVNDAQVAKSQFIADDTNKVFLLADPTKSLSYYNLLNNNIDSYYLSIQSLLKNTDDIDGFAQAGLFVKKDIRTDKRVDIYLKSLEQSIKKINDQSLIDENNSKIKELGYYNFSNEILLSAISGSNIRYVKGSEMKEIVEKTYSINTNLIGGSLADEGFYQD